MSAAAQTPQYQLRQAQKAANAAYRRAAARRIGESVSEWAAVHPMPGGAFVDVTVWVPASEIAEREDR